jgi:hypothetical protein
MGGESSCLSVFSNKNFVIFSHGCLHDMCFYIFLNSIMQCIYLKTLLGAPKTEVLQYLSLAQMTMS